MADSGKKRSLDSADRPESLSKRTTGKKQWRTPRKTQNQHFTTTQIEPGDVGIFATCSMKREVKCLAEVQDLFDEYATKMYGVGLEENSSRESGDEAKDIAAEIAKEIEEMQTKKSSGLFTNVKLDTECVVFVKTRDPVEPVSFVHEICKDSASSERAHSRFIQKLTPMTLFAKATEKGLDEVAQKVLAPHFHGESRTNKKFAIRPNFRNHTVLKRLDVIQKVAAAVGPGHQVDLKNYDLLILVEVHKNVLGMSVVGSDYDQLKRYNISELQQPTVSKTEG